MANDQRRTGGLTARGAMLAVLLSAAAMAAGCASQPSVMTAEPNIPPANYKTEILAYLRTYQNDPTGIREAFITEPALQPIAGTQRYASCLRYNAKNSVGKYEGRKDRVVAFLAGRLDTMVLARGDQCKEANWQPFPELEKLTR